MVRRADFDFTNCDEPIKAIFKISPPTVNYELLINKPKINHIELIGDKSLEDLGIILAITNLIDEHNTSEEAHQYIQTLISNEATAREEADRALDGRIDDEIIARTGADNLLRRDLEAETFARQQADGVLQGNIDTEARDRQIEDSNLAGRIVNEALLRENADTALQGNINLEEQARIQADGALQASITGIENLIPSEATTSNTLADKAYVITNIQAYAASFRGSWATWADVPTDINLYPEDALGNKTPDKNDYMIVLADETRDGGTWKYVYTGLWSVNGKSGWEAEVEIEKTPLTPEQQAALDSGITSTLVEQITTNQNDISDINTTLGSKISLTDLSSSATGLDYDNTTGVFSLTSGYVIPEQSTLNNLQRNFTFAEKGITHTTSSYSTIDLAKEIAALQLDMSTTLFGEVRLNDMPTGIGNAEMKVEVQQRSGSTSVLAFTLTSTNVAPHEWTFYWVGTGTSGSPATTSWYATVREDMVLTRTNTSSYTPTGDYNPATKKYVDDTAAEVLPTQTGNEGKFLTTNGSVASWDNIPTYSDFVGADGTNAGTAGLVPAPLATDNTKYLKGDGTWDSVDALPDQTSQSGKFLTTNGSSASWANVPEELPTQTGHSGEFLTTNGSAVSWASVDALPSQSGNSGKYLTTNGTDASWNDLPVSDVEVNGSSVVNNGTASITVPVNISDLTDDTATYPIDKADTLTGLTASITELNYVDGVTSSIQTQFNDITEKIPAQASDSNQLADKDFVNSSIATETANFIGTFENESALEAYAGTVTNNDYAFVINSVVTDNGNDWADFASLDAYSKTHLTNFDYAWVVNGSNFDLYRFDIVEQEWVSRATAIAKDSVTLNTAYNRYKAVVENSTVTWTYEYTLNNSSFTAQQWAAINSGITSSAVTQITTNQNAIGNLSSLSTTDKSNLVSAINEVQGDIPTNYVTTDTAQDITATKTFKAIQRIQNGDASGCLIVGADLSSSTLTNGTRKLGRMGFPTNEDITLNCAFVSCDTLGQSLSTIENSVEFGGRPGDTTSTSPDVINFTVAKEHNTTNSAKKQIALRIDKNAANFTVQPQYNGNDLVDTASNQTITGNKTFTGDIEIQGTAYNNTLVLKRTSTLGCYITFRNSQGILGHIGLLEGSGTPRWLNSNNTENRIIVRAGGDDTVAVGDTSTPVYIDSNGIAQVCSSSILVPAQSGNSGKVLTTDGTTASWGYAARIREWVD